MADKLYYFKTIAENHAIRTNNPQYYTDAERYSKITKTEYETLHRAECKEQLLKHLSRGDTVYSIIRHVSANGMSRRIDFYAIRDNKPIYLTGYIEGLLHSYKRHAKGDGLIIGGSGMDMAFHVVYNVASALFDDNTGSDSGYALKSERI